MDSKEQSIRVRIGDVLQEAGVMTDEQIQERLEISKTIGQPLGQTLLQFGDLSKQQLRDVIQIQSLVLDGVVGVPDGIEAVRLVCLERKSLEEALIAVGYNGESIWCARLGELLLAADIIQPGDLKRALSEGYRECVPLGHALVKLDITSPTVIAAALSLQKKIRHGEVTKDEAIAQLVSGDATDNS